MLHLIDDRDFLAFRKILREADFSVEGLLKSLGPISLPVLPDPSTCHLLHLTRYGRPLDSLIRLFVMGVPVNVQAVALAIDPVPIEVAMAAGLLEISNGNAFGCVKLLPYGDVVVAVDQCARPEVKLLPDQVVGLTNSTITLATSLLRLPFRTALDLGSGSGILAIHAAQTTGEVWGVDCSARSIEFARFNARLNGCRNTHFLLGDAFEPVAGKKFDHIFSNPPFAISPSREYAYRDSGMPEDEFCRDIVRKAPEFLNDQGYLQIICDWVQRAGQDWKETIREWVADNGCDSWILHLGQDDAASYAHRWVKDTEHGGDRALMAKYQEWVEYFEQARIEQIHSGLIVLRRNPAGKNWVRIDENPQLTSGYAGDDLLRGFALSDYLQASSDQTILETTLKLSPKVRLEQHTRPEGATWVLESARIFLNSPLMFSGNIDQDCTMLISGCNSGNTVWEVIESIAAEHRLDASRIMPDCVSLVRTLIQRGYLLPPAIAKQNQPPADPERGNAG